MRQPSLSLSSSVPRQMIVMKRSTVSNALGIYLKRLKFLDLPAKNCLTSLRRKMVAHERHCTESGVMLRHDGLMVLRRVSCRHVSQFSCSSLVLSSMSHSGNFSRQRSCVCMRQETRWERVSQKRLQRLVSLPALSNGQSSLVEELLRPRGSKKA